MLARAALFSSLSSTAHCEAFAKEDIEEQFIHRAETRPTRCGIEVEWLESFPMKGHFLNICKSISVRKISASIKYLFVRFLIISATQL